MLSYTGEDFTHSVGQRHDFIASGTVIDNSDPQTTVWKAWSHTSQDGHPNRRELPENRLHVGAQHASDEPDDPGDGWIRYPDDYPDAREMMGVRYESEPGLSVADRRPMRRNQNVVVSNDPIADRYSVRVQ